jgi:hypothetical protein
VTARLADRLRGDWSPARNPVVAAWRADLIDVRNRVAHLGERPSAGEVATALNIPSELFALVKDRVAAAFPTYGRTAFFILGTDELTARFGERWDTFRDDHDDEPMWYATFAAWRTDVLARTRAMRSASRGTPPYRGCGGARAAPRSARHAGRSTAEDPASPHAARDYGSQRGRAGRPLPATVYELARSPLDPTRHGPPTCSRQESAAQDRATRPAVSQFRGCGGRNRYPR